MVAAFVALVVDAVEKEEWEEKERERKDNERLERQRAELAAQVRRFV